MGREIPFVGFLGATPLMLLPLLLSESKSIHNSQRDPNDKFVRMASKILAIKVNSPYLTLACKHHNVFSGQVKHMTVTCISV